jgi:hypothetical protein
MPETNAGLERRRERREGKPRRDAAVAELLTATVDLLSGAQVIQALMGPVGLAVAYAASGDGVRCCVLCVRVCG